MSRYTEEYGDQRRGSSSSGLLSAGLTLLGGLAVGGAMMYLLDPEEGTSRRKYIRRTAGGAVDSVTGLLGSAYDSVADGTSDLAGRAGRLVRESHDQARDYVEADDDMGTGMMLTMILGGSALAAVVYLLTTEYDSIRQGDFRGAASHAYQRASDAASQVAGRAGEMFGGEAKDQQAGQAM